MPKSTLVFCLLFGFQTSYAQFFNRSIAQDSLYPTATAVTSWGDSTLVAYGSVDNVLQLRFFDKDGKVLSLKRDFNSFLGIRSLHLHRLSGKRLLLAVSRVLSCKYASAVIEDYYLLDHRLQTLHSKRIAHSQIPGSIHKAFRIHRMSLLESGEILSAGPQGFRVLDSQDLHEIADTLYGINIFGSNAVHYAPDTLYFRNYSTTGHPAFFYNISSGSTTPAPKFGKDLIDIDAHYWADWDLVGQTLCRVRKRDFTVLDSLSFNSTVGFNPKHLFVDSSGITLLAGRQYHILSLDFAQHIASGHFHSGFSPDFGQSQAHFHGGKLYAFGLDYPFNAQLEVFDAGQPPAPVFQSLVQKLALVDKRTLNSSNFIDSSIYVEVETKWKVTILNHSGDSLKSLALQKNIIRDGTCPIKDWQTLYFDSLRVAPGDSFTFQLLHLSSDISGIRDSATAKLILQPVMANGNLVDWHGVADTSVLFNLSRANYALAQSIRVYPNPAREHLWLEMPATLSKQAAGYRLYNLQGQAVLRGSLDHSSQQRIELGTLPAALYALVIEDEQGQVLARTKLRLVP